MLEMIVRALAGPIVTGFTDGYKAHLQATTTALQTRAKLATDEEATQRAEISATAQYRIAEIGHWYEPDKLFEYILVSYFGKCIVWDTMLGLGSTPSLKGLVGEWAGLIILYLFGKRGIENVARIMKG